MTLKLIIIITFSLLLQGLCLAGEFTPDHLEGIYGGSSTSMSDPRYCQLRVMKSRADDGTGIFEITPTFSGEKLATFKEAQVTLQNQLDSHGKFIILNNGVDYVHINLNGASISTFYFHKLNTDKQIIKQFTCSGR